METLLDRTERGLDKITEFVLDQASIPSSVLENLEVLQHFLEVMEEYIFEQEFKENQKNEKEEPRKEKFRWW